MTLVLKTIYNTQFWRNINPSQLDWSFFSIVHWKCLYLIKDGSCTTYGPRFSRQKVTLPPPEVATLRKKWKKVLDSNGLWLSLQIACKAKTLTLKLRCWRDFRLNWKKKVTKLINLHSGRAKKHFPMAALLIAVRTVDLISSDCSAAVYQNLRTWYFPFGTAGSSISFRSAWGQLAQNLESKVRILANFKGSIFKQFPR